VSPFPATVAFMSEISINVRGSHEVRLAPERGIVHALLSREGSSAAPIFESVVASLAQVRDSLEPIHDAKAGPVTRFTFDQVRTSARRPWHERGKQLPLVHSATVTITVEFSDFTELGKWITWSSRVEGLTVQWIDWDLTTAHRSEIERSTRQEAVRQAKNRAQDYADALDLGAVKPRSISDPGVREVAYKAPMMARAMDVGSQAAPELDLAPQDIEIRAEVEATFIV
jgi:uncharacterized protein YggE